MQEFTSSKVALVTGVSRAEGIGFEECRQLADRKITVFLTARNLENAEQLAARLKAESAGRDVRVASLDVTDDEQVKRLAEQIEQAYGKLDILINNAAGLAPYGEQAASADLEMAQEVMNKEVEVLQRPDMAHARHHAAHGLRYKRMSLRAACLAARVSFPPTVTSRGAGRHSKHRSFPMAGSGGVCLPGSDPGRYWL